MFSFKWPAIRSIVQVQVHSKMMVSTIQEEKTPSQDSNYQQEEFYFWEAMLFFLAWKFPKYLYD